jgi:hypothetical protein
LNNAARPVHDEAFGINLFLHAPLAPWTLALSENRPPRFIVGLDLNR